MAYIMEGKHLSETWIDFVNQIFGNRKSKQTEVKFSEQMDSPGVI